MRARAILPALLALCAAPSVAAEDVADDPFAGLVPLGDEVLAESRGRLSLGGYAVEFGISVMANGQPIGSFSTNADALQRALSDAGIAPDRFTIEASDPGRVTVIRNGLDNTVIGQTVIFDVVVTDIPMGYAGPAGSILRDLPPPSTFGSF